MRKRLILIMLATLFVLTVNSGVKAYTCEYGPEYGGTGDFSAKFKVSGITSPDVDYSVDSWAKDKIENWSTKIGGINGQVFQEGGKCPDRIFYVNGGLLTKNLEVNGICTPASIDVPLTYIEQFLYVSGTINGKNYDNDLKKAIDEDLCSVSISVSYLVKQPDDGGSGEGSGSEGDSGSEDVCSGYSSCLDFGSGDCTNNSCFSCMWVETDSGGYCNTDNLQYIKCGSAFDIPKEAPTLVSFAVNLLKIAVPIILIVTSIISLVKALMASKDDEIKKAQKILVRRIITAVLTFFVISIVQFIVLLVADDGDYGDIDSCMSCLLNNSCSGSKYYKTNVAGTNVCHYLSGEEFECADSGN